MASDETFYRDDPLEVQPAWLAADHYNLAHRLLVRGGADCLFVPIRSLQYLAVLDAEEIIFVDREAKHLVALAWCRFQPQTRAALTDPVAYELRLYQDPARAILPQLQAEFFKALRQMDKRTSPGTRDQAVAPIVPFPAGRDRRDK